MQVLYFVRARKEWSKSRNRQNEAYIAARLQSEEESEPKEFVFE